MKRTYAPVDVKTLIDAIGTLTIQPGPAALSFPPNFLVGLNTRPLQDRKSQSPAPITDRKMGIDLSQKLNQTARGQAATAACNTTVAVTITDRKLQHLRLDPMQIEEKLRSFFDTHQPQTTKRSYGTYIRRFKEFMNRRKYPFHGDPKNTDLYVSEFLMGCATGIDGHKKLASSTIMNVVSGAVADFYRFDAHTPTRSKICKTTKAAVRKAAPKARAAKAPLPLARLRQLIEATRRDPNLIAASRDACIFLIMYGGLLRESEVVNLKNINIHSTSVKIQNTDRVAVRIDVVKAKNDQDEKGSQRLIPELTEDKQLCLVTAMKLYEKHRNTIHKNFVYSLQRQSVGSQLKASSPSEILKHRLSQITPPIPKTELATYASNSLRKGGATAMFNNGGNKLQVKRHGAWRSDAVDAYITVDKSALAELVESIFTENETNYDSSDDDE
jgi:integrase